MNTNSSGWVAANAKRIETWERLRARLFGLAELGDELAMVAAGPVTAWLYREIETEAATVAAVAGAYVDECERFDRHPVAGMNGAELFLAGVAGLAVMSVVVKAKAGVRRAQAAADIARAGTSPVSLVGRVLVTALVIVGVQWLVLTRKAGGHR